MNCFTICIGLLFLVCLSASEWVVNETCDVTFNQKCCNVAAPSAPEITGCKCRCGMPLVAEDGEVDSKDEGKNIYCKADEVGWPTPTKKRGTVPVPSCGAEMNQVCCNEASKRKSKRIDSSKSSDSDSDTNSHSKHSSSSLSESEELKKKPETSELIPWYSLDTTKLNKLPMSKLRDSNQNTDSESHLHSKGKYTSSLARSKSNDATLKSKKTRDEEEVVCHCRCKAADTVGECPEGAGIWYHGDGGNPDSESDEDVVEGSDATKNNGNKLEAIINFINFLFILILLMI